MLMLIEKHHAQLVALCRAYGVDRLELIGSAARGDFDPTESDLDFLVEFKDLGWKGASDRYFGLLHGLEDLFLNKVDLIERKAIQNRFFLEVAEQYRDLLYAA